MLKFKLDEGELDSLGDDVKSLYDEAGVLKVEGIPKEDVSGLKRKVEELLGEKKSAQQKAAEAEAQAKAETEEKLKKAKDFEQLYNSSESERKKAAEELSGLKTAVASQKIESEANLLAGNLTKDLPRAKLLSEKIASRLSVVDGEVKVLDSDGNLTVSTKEEMLAQIKSEYPFLVDGSQAAGGGAIGSSSGAGDSKTIGRADFDGMTDFQRMSFVKSGGKIYD